MLFLFVLLLPHLGHAQKKSTLKDRWRNSIGASVHLLHVNENVSPAFGLFYNPQINIVNKYADFSLAATMPLTLGAHIKDTWIEESFFYGHIPAVLEANLGHYSTRDFRSNIGMSLGAGYGAQIAGSRIGSGVVGTVSARTWFFKGSLTIRYMFHYNVQGNGYDTHCLSLAVNMGNYFKKLDHMNKMSKFQNFK
ncbi:MAG: hypothetical protein H6602_13785 [Flavobacteriales bacterium]|nr:hypothetical protein [Flavobacteriales bacterium]